MTPAGSHSGWGQQWDQHSDHQHPSLLAAFSYINEGALLPAKMIDFGWELDWTWSLSSVLTGYRQILEVLFDPFLLFCFVLLVSGYVSYKCILATLSLGNCLLPSFMAGVPTGLRSVFSRGHREV